MTALTWQIESAPANGTYFFGAWSPALSIGVAVGDLFSTGRAAMYTHDGITWAYIAAGSGMLANSGGIAWAPSLAKFVALEGTSPTAQVYTSPDGIVFTAQGNPFGSVANRQPAGIAWSETQTLFVVATNGGTGGPKIWTSPNGTAWTERTRPFTTRMTSPAFSPTLGLWAVCGTGGTTDRIATSPDGIAWTPVSTPFDGAFASGIFWSDIYSRFIAFGFDATFTNSIGAWSANGSVWSSLSGSIFDAVHAPNYGCDAGDRIIATGSGTSGETIFESTDGATFVLSGTSPFPTLTNFPFYASSLADPIPIIVGGGYSNSDPGKFAIPTPVVAPTTQPLIACKFSI